MNESLPVFNPFIESPENYQEIEELRACPEFAHLDDDAARQVIDSIREFCTIIAGSCRTFHCIASEEIRE